MCHSAFSLAASARASVPAEDITAWFRSNLPATELLATAAIGGDWQLLSVLQGMLVLARRRWRDAAAGLPDNG